jgi:hypothetical protein
MRGSLDPSNRHAAVLRVIKRNDASRIKSLHGMIIFGGLKNPGVVLLGI